MDKKQADVILISDIHLGANYCHADELIAMLESWKFKKLILVGDVFQHGDFDRLHKMDRFDRSHWKVLSYFRQLTDPAFGVEVIWIEGNHDWKVLDIVGAMLGINIYDEYIWEFGGKKFIAIHGHQFDLRLPEGEFISRLGQNIYLLLQRYFQYSVTRFISKIGKKFSRSTEFVRKGAMAYALSKHCDYVFCGHTHKPESFSEVIENKTVSYFNCGTWADSDKLTFITITGTDVAIEEFPMEHHKKVRPKRAEKKAILKTIKTNRQKKILRH
jgi:UDP-2,3-diacylglucosamine pyrophosphatase LpxH